MVMMRALMTMRALVMMRALMMMGAVMVGESKVVLAASPCHRPLS